MAKGLLGRRLVHFVGGQRLSGLIVETEAYLGLKDPACHSYHGKITARTKTFYLPGGHAYVYMIYGMHYCFNVVTRSEKHPEAVLIRALVPEEGIEFMKRNRPNARGEKDLCSGPGKLCQALGIDRSLNEADLEGDRIFIEKGIRVPAGKILSTPRIGVDYAGEAARWPLRFSLED